MKRTPPFGLDTWILGFAAFILVVVSGISSPPTTSSCCGKTEASAAVLSDKSLYQTESRWTTDTGKQIKLVDLRGRPQVVVMFFASCQSACPVLVHDLQRIEASLTPDQRARVGFTLVTIDPRRDTPEALAKYRATRSLATNSWTLLRGEPTDIEELAAILGVKYKEQAGGQFAHSNLITVLNSEGEIIHQLAGLGQDINATVRVIERLISGGSSGADIAKE